MRSLTLVLLAAAALWIGANPAHADSNPSAYSTSDDWPLWAYGVTAPPQPDDRAKPQGAPGPSFDPDISREEQLRPLRVEGSYVRYTRVELNDWQHTPDWFPDEHGPVPSAILRGPASIREQTRACGFCHRLQGGGRPENAPVFGLPEQYFLRQLEDFRAGRRHSSDPRKPNVPTMIALATALSDEAARAVAAFWSTQRGGPHVRLIESDRAPPTRLRGNLYVKTSEQLIEPLVDRIVEVPENLELSGDLDDPRSGYVAYVPVGSIAQGQSIVRTGRRAGDSTSALTTACRACHGDALLGLGDAPPIAGRSPSYVARQLHDFKTGARRGSMAAQMQPVVAGLGAQDMLVIAAYVASLPRFPGEPFAVETVRDGDDR